MSFNFSATIFKKQFHKCLLLILATTLLSSCNGIGLDNIFNKSFSIDDRAKFKDVTFPDTTAALDSYSVIIISDIHFPSCRKNDFIAKITSVDFTAYGTPAMVVALGDLTNDGTHEQYEVYNEFAEELHDSLGVPVFPVPGNHDSYDTALNGRNYLQDIYPTTFYRIKLHDLSWYFLDSADGTFGYNQLHTLENLFSTDSNKKIICTHYPLYTDSLFYRLSNYKERAHVIKMCAENDVALYLCGHTHIYSEHDFNSFRQILCGSLVGDDEAPSFIILSFYNDGRYERTVFTL